jgi:fatty acid desaturase
MMMVETIQSGDHIQTGDHSNTFHRLRNTLTNSSGERYVDFMRQLKPDFAVVRRDIARGYGMLIATCLAMIAALHAQVPAGVVVAFGALSIGYWIAYLQLFIHEGAHFNLDPDRDKSDRLCNCFIGWMVGAHVQGYRIVHFQHHRALGTVDDTEVTYFFPLNMVFIVKTLLGIRALEVIAARRRFAQTAQTKKARSAERTDTGAGLGLRTMLGGVAMHALIVAVLWLTGGIPAALAWVLGIGMIFPFLGALRQLLEHRADDASSGIDYSRADHGAFTRVFSGGMFAATFGGAGFDRHLLHHWEPQVSYTRLADLERFLMDTDMGRIIDARRTTYRSAFMRLFKSA